MVSLEEFIDEFISEGIADVFFFAETAPERILGRVSKGIPGLISDGIEKLNIFGMISIKNPWRVFWKNNPLRNLQMNPALP